MYAVYEFGLEGDRRRYRFDRQVSLFGCNAGKIVHHLRKSLQPTDSQPHAWHVPMAATMAEQSRTVIIDLKPDNKNPQSSRSLYELLDVWGYSADGWTPVMLRLRALVIDGDPPVADPRDFEADLAYHRDPIYSFLYLAGSIEEGAIVGRWTAPRASPTNSALLWPESLSYFVDQIRLYTPGALTRRAT